METLRTVTPSVLKFWEKSAISSALPKPARAATKAAVAVKPNGEGEKAQDRRQEALDLVVETIEALQGERGEDERVWGSMVKQALKRRKPGFNETYYGFRSFSSLLEEAEARGLLKLERDERSGGHIVHLTVQGD